MIFNFRRYEVPETYYSDIDISIPPGVKYDLYDGSHLVGTFIDGYNKTFARFKDGDSYKRHTKIFGSLANAHYLLNDHEPNFAYVTIYYTIVKILKAKLEFYDDPSTYIMDYNNFNGSKGFDLVIDIKAGDQTVFSLKNTSKRKFLSRNSDRPMEGTIEISDSLHRDKIFGFLLAIQLYYRRYYRGRFI
ncbi:hypothetical protein FAM09_22210 [Niastella caeni]|uniref:Uncharacterized protein n=1 Tax=Niastella caeni TaxID=2569763 RepID=A0A4S8HN07_9BACT|nr:hypothetical protein [Niastella caeni]THU36101.1 hypothetical protein FAM09_22210 [Niastella caeni]